MREQGWNSRKLFLVILALMEAIFATGFSPVIVTPGDTSEWGATRNYIAGLQQPPVPEVSAAAYLVVNPTTNRIVMAHQEHERRAPASLTKIATYLAARDMADRDLEDDLDLETRLWVAESDFYPYTAIGMQEGDSFTLEDILYILLVPSDNAAAVTIGRSLSGSEDAFVEEMNTLITSQGLQNTRFMNAHGLDEPGQYSSAFDLAVLSRMAMDQPLFAEIVRQVQVDRGGYRLTTTNELLSSYEGAVGIKTGTTDDARQCLIGWVERPSGNVLTVVLGSQDRIGDTMALLDYYYRNYTELFLDLPSSALNTYRDSSGDLHEFTIAEPLTFLTHTWQLSSVRYVRRLWNLPDAPVGGEQVGALEVWMGRDLLAELPLYVRY